MAECERRRMHRTDRERVVEPKRIRALPVLVRLLSRDGLRSFRNLFPGRVRGRPSSRDDGFKVVKGCFEFRAERSDR